MTNVTLLAATRPRLLRQTLESIGDISNATVMIRDAGMSPEVSKVIDEWKRGKDQAIWFHDPRPMGTGPARNEVIINSESAFGRGDHLYIGDDDTYFLHRDWLKVLTTAYEEAKAEYGFRAMGIYCHPFNRPMLPRRLECRWTVSEVYALASQSMLMDWDTWDEFGPFCDTPAGKVCQSEDVDFSNRIRAAGYKVGVISPPLLVNTGITNSFGEHIPGWELVKSQAPEGVLCE